MEKILKILKTFLSNQDQDFPVFVLEAPRDRDFGLEDYITV